MLGLSRGISSYKETFELTPSDARKDHASNLFDCTAEYQIESQGNVKKSSGIKRIERKQKSMEGEMAATKHSIMYGSIETTWRCLQQAKVLRMSSTFLLPLHLFFIVFQGWWQYNTWNNGATSKTSVQTISFDKNFTWKSLATMPVAAVLLRRNVKVQEITKAEAVSWCVEKTGGFSICPKFRW